jgi:micrococcal nuclease
MSVMIAKRAILFIIMLFACLSLARESFNKVNFVSDGDTIVLGSGETIRYLGIDAPEIDREGGKGEFLAEAARDFNSGLVKHVRIRLEYDQEARDRYGRILAYVFLENGDMVNALLIRNGLAHVMLTVPNVKYRELLLDCQREAMKKRLGIWCRPAEKEEKFYLGNTNSYRFHRPGCPFANKISRQNVVRFMSRYDAFWEGYSPCKRCTP